MKTRIDFAIACAMGFGLWTAAPGFAHAQDMFGRPPQNITRPTTSPYLNLFNGGGFGNFGLNYFQQVRPQQQFRSAIQQQERNLNRLRTSIHEPTNANATIQSPTSRLGTTGHPTSFLNTGTYFPNIPQISN